MKLRPMGPAQKAPAVTQDGDDIQALRGQLQEKINRGTTSVRNFISRVTHASDDAGEPATAAVAEALSGGDQKYEIGTFVARGGMGAIFEVQDQSIQREVALKVMRKQQQGVLDSKTMRFIHEAQITGQLEHPNIVPVHELGVDADGSVFYTMKFVRGVTLESVLQGIRKDDPVMIEAFPLARLLTIFQKVCDAMAFSHSKGVLHRDLKPDNIMIGDYGEVLVMDWGLAKIVHPAVRSGDGNVLQLAQSDLVDMEAAPQGGGPAPSTVWSEAGAAGDGHESLKTMDGTILGTPAYMSPEQAEGKIEELDERADIYTLGGILYTILTLDPPFQAASLNSLLMYKLAGDFTPPTDYNPDSAVRARKKKDGAPLPMPLHCPDNSIPGPLSAVCQKAMSLKPDDRYQSVLEIQAEIENHQAGFATEAEDASLVRLLLLLLKRHWAEALIASGSFCLLVVVMTVLLVFLARKNRETEVALGDAQTAQRELLSVSKSAAPKFVREAEDFIEAAQWKKAQGAVGIAAKLDPDLGASWFVQGRLLLAAREFTAAAARFDTAANKAAGGISRAKAQSYKKVADSYAESADDTVAERDRLQLAADLKRLKDRPLVVRQYEELIRDQLQAKQTDGAIRAALSFLTYLNPGIRQLNSLPPIVKDGRLALTLTGNGELVDLSGLAALPITELNLEDCRKLTDLSPLAGMQLQHLNVANSAVADIAALEGMPLRELDLSRTKVAELRALAGMPLEKLSLRKLPIASIAPLKGAPLKELDLGYTDRLRDISPLAGMPLAQLRLDSSSVKDLAPLAGMPLKQLSLQYLRASDIKPLAGMPLEELDLFQTQVKDLSVLRRMPLQKLYLANCRQVTDLSPLADCKELTTLTIPAQITRIEFLKSLPKLRTLSDSKMVQSAQDFWKKHGGN